MVAQGPHLLSAINKSLKFIMCLLERLGDKTYIPRSTKNMTYRSIYHYGLAHSHLVDASQVVTCKHDRNDYVISTSCDP